MLTERERDQGFSFDFRYYLLLANKNIFKGLTKNFIGEKMSEKIKESEEEIIREIIGKIATTQEFKNCVRIANGEVPKGYGHYIADLEGDAELKGYDPRWGLADPFAGDLYGVLQSAKFEAEGKLTKEGLRKLLERILDIVDDEIYPGRTGGRLADALSDIIMEYRRKDIPKLLADFQAKLRRE